MRFMFGRWVGIRYSVERNSLAGRGGRLQSGGSLYSSFWGSNSKSLTSRRRSSRRASYRGSAIRLPHRQDLQLFARLHHAAKSDTAAACDRAIFSQSLRQLAIVSPDPRTKCPLAHLENVQTPLALTFVTEPANCALDNCCSPACIEESLRRPGIERLI